MKICFIIYPSERMGSKTDTALRLIHEATFRRHRVALMLVQNVSLRDNVTSAFFKVIRNTGNITHNITSFYPQAHFKKRFSRISKAASSNTGLARTNLNLQTYGSEIGSRWYIFDG